MKKKALCIFILVFWMVAACTFLSIKVEEQMIPQVTKISPSSGKSMRDGSILPADCLMLDDYGMPHLYSIYEGTGWEAGTRVSEVQGGYEIHGDELKMDNAWGTYVQYSSKPLEPGQLVEVVRGTTTEEGSWLDLFPELVRDKTDAGSRWLAVFPEGEKPDSLTLPEGVTIEEENDHVVQLVVQKDVEPFMEAQAKSMVPELNGAKVYSFTDMRKLLENFHGFSLLLLILSAVLTIWGFSCFLTKKARENRRLLVVNLAIGLVLLACVPLVLHSIDLPSSLLPREQITDFGYFAQEMDEFFGALKSFAPEASATGMLAPNLPESPVGIGIINARNGVIFRPILYLVGGVFLAGLLSFVEWFTIWYKNRPRIK